MKKNILVVDDSALMRRAICDIINSGDEFEATDTCRDGLEAYEKIKNNSYDAVLLDINMPRMNGLELLQKLQKENIRATVVVVSSLAKEDAKITIQAMEYGAIDFITKPENIIEAKGVQFRTELSSLLNSILPQAKTAKAALSQPAASRQTPGRTPGMASFAGKQPGTAASKTPSAASTRAALSAAAARASAAAGSASSAVNAAGTASAGAARTVSRRASGGSGGKKLIALACSTGGPKSLQSVIPYLDKNMDAPMVLVQHMPTGFTKSMAERLNELSKVQVKEAQENDVLKKGCVYVAPGGYHLEVVAAKDGTHKIHLSDAPAIGGLRPCANVMYRSLKRSSYDEIVCVVLTGMGADGTDGIKELNRAKPIYVIAQDEPTCVVYGMPKAIAEAGLVDEVVPLTNIPKRIINQVGVK
ncbi:MAG: chemotaxis-specific protein-glutamate methyltransferase CheB [Eubacterium sp.]|nr:chemotaxis-specific protein-glutamate methyltransferase CheB [Eubacterium sp.]